ncbi:MAG TPA: hypothetical protein VFW66_12875 [Gemmatimonadales bacterium]|nr:hypothetical protein [Gemmatimonadales bacterium]
MIALGLLLQLATVGDTFWVQRTVAVPPGREVRAADWKPADPLEVLGSPRVTLRGDSAVVAYPVTVWMPGEHTVPVPGPVLLSADGRVDSLPPDSVTLVVASVLPARSVSALRPQPRVPIVPTRERRVLPILILLGGAALALVPVHLLWRRRGRSVPVPDAGAMPAPVLPLARWARAGETRVTADAAAARLRAVLAARVPEADAGMETEWCLALLATRRPDWPLAELGALLRALNAARFAPGDDADAAGLLRRADALEASLAA